MTTTIKKLVEKSISAIAFNPTIAILTAIFAIFSIIASHYNQKIFFIINQNFPTWLDVSMFYLSNLGDGIIAVLLSLWLLLGNSRKGIIGIVSLLVLMVLVQSLKRYFDMPRPAAVFDSLKVIGPVLHRHSFPSGHSATIWAMVTLLLIDKKTHGFVLVLLGILGSFARVYVGAHFPFDVAVGALVGIASVIISTITIDLIHFRWTRFEKSSVRFAIMGITLIFSIYVSFFHLHNQSLGFFTFVGGLSAIGVLIVLYSLFRSKIIPNIATPMLR